MTKRGMRCASYDPLFFPSDERVTRDRHDFITCCEVPEHCKDPRREYEHLPDMLKRGRILGVMTQLVPESFESWWYHRDPRFLNMDMETAFVLHFRGALGYRAGAICVAAANRERDTFVTDIGAHVGDAVRLVLCALAKMRT